MKLASINRLICLKMLPSLQAVNDADLKQWLNSTFSVTPSSLKALSACSTEQLGTAIWETAWITRAELSAVLGTAASAFFRLRNQLFRLRNVKCSAGICSFIIWYRVMQWQSATIFNCKQANIYYFLLQKVDFVRIWRTKVGGMEWLSNKSEGDASYSSPPSDTRLAWWIVYCIVCFQAHSISLVDSI